MPSVGTKHQLKVDTLAEGKRILEDISFLLVKAGGARPQGVRKQMAGSSVRNCMSQIATLLMQV